MADYPADIFEYRTMQNLQGLTFDGADTRTLFAEDFNALVEEIIAIEDTLGLGLLSGYDTLSDRLDDQFGDIADMFIDVGFAIGAMLPLAGGTMSGNIIMHGYNIYGGTATTSDLFLCATTANAVGGASVQIRTGNNGGTTALYADYEGKVGIGTSPTAKFHVSSGSGGYQKGILLKQDSNNGSASSSYTSIDFEVPTTGLVGQFFLTANNYSAGGVYIPANTLGLLGQSTSSYLTLGVAGSSREIRIFVGGFGSSNMISKWTQYGLVIGGTTDYASAKLAVNSTTQGFLPPRMTGSQAEAISSPAEGLIVYATSGNGSVITSVGWWGKGASTWEKLN